MHFLQCHRRRVDCGDLKTNCSLPCCLAQGAYLQLFLCKFTLTKQDFPACTFLRLVQIRSGASLEHSQQADESLSAKGARQQTHGLCCLHQDKRQRCAWYPGARASAASAQVSQRRGTRATWMDREISSNKDSRSVQLSCGADTGQEGGLWGGAVSRRHHVHVQRGLGVSSCQQLNFVCWQADAFDLCAGPRYLLAHEIHRSDGDIHGRRPLAIGLDHP